MSKTIDEKVVEMRLDNSNFEKNASTSIGTLAKLRQSLNLTGASKGLEQVDAAAKKVDMRGLGTAVETVSAKFSAMQVMGVTALANITNSAVNAGKRMISALTIDPVKTGFQEYETQINAVQTILANTQSKGTTLPQVNEALEQLNKYADQTIYNFTEMTRNIGTFTAAGVDLDTSVSAIKGIANLAAVSGSSSQQASTAMYQLSQALAAGKVSLMDWNSVVNAGMGGQVFQDALRRTSEVMGTGAEAAIKKYGSFRESLTQGEWLTTEVLTETLNQFTMSAKEGTKQWEEYKASLKEKGYTEAQAVEILKMANTATDAATEVKTFTQLWDVLKESAQSGWSQTWKLIIGDFEDAKALLSPVSKVLTGIIETMSDARNKVLEGALGKTFKHLLDPLKSVKETINNVTEPVKNVTKTLDDYNKVVKEVIRGDWGKTKERWDALAKAGYDWATVQNMVNEKLGSSKRHATEYSIEQGKTAKSTKELTETNNEYIAKLAEMSEAELKALGLEPKQIEAIQSIKKEADKLGLSVKDFLANIDNLDGRWVVIQSFKNVWNGLSGVFKAISTAWKEVFPPKSIEERSAKLYDFIAAIHKFTTKLKLLDEDGNLTENGEKIMRTFKGVFAVVSIVADVVGGGLRIAFKLVSAILGYFDLNLLDVTAAIGDALVKFREMTDISKLFSKAIEFVVPILAKVINKFRDWGTAFVNLPVVQKFIDGIIAAFNNLKGIDFKEIGLNVIEGFKNGFVNGVKNVVDLVMELGVKILKGIKEVLGIHSPSTEFFEIGSNIIAGLVNGIQNGASKVWETIKSLGQKCIDFISGIDWGAVFAVGVSGGLLVLIKKISDAFQALSGPLEGITGVLESCEKVVKNFAKIEKSFSKVLKSLSMNIKADAIKKIAISIAILAGSVIALSFIDTGKLWSSVGAILALSVILVGLSIATEKLSKASASIDKDGINIDGFKSGLLAIGTSLLLLAATVKIMGSMDPEQMKQGFKGLAVAILAVGVVFAAYGLVSKFGTAKHMDKVGGMLVKMSISLIMLIGVAKLAGKLSPGELTAGALALAAFAGFTLAMVGISKLAGKRIDKMGGTLLKLSLAMILMVGVVKMVGTLKRTDAEKGVVFAIAFGIFVATITAIIKTAGKDVPKMGGLLLALSTSMLLLIGVMKLVSMLEPDEIIKGGIFIVAFGIFVKSLAKALTGTNVPKMAGTLLAMSVSVGILAAICVMMSLMSWDGLIKGGVAVGALSVFMATMIWATRGATQCVGNLVVMTVAIAILAAAVAALSMIEPTKLIAPTLAMIALMGMFTVLIKVAGMAQTSIGPLIVMTVAIGLIAGVLYALAQLPIESTLGAAASLAIVLLSLTGALAILAAIGPFASAAIPGMIALGIFIAGLTTVMAALGALTLIPGFKELMEEGGGMLGKIGYALGNFVGSIVGGLAAGITTGLPEIAKNLSDFMTNLQPFITGVKLVDDDVLLKVGSLAGAILLLTAANLITGITQFLPFIGSFAQIGTELSAFMINAMPFMAGIKMVDPAALEAVKSLAEAILILTAANLIEGLIRFAGGTSSLSNFGSQLGQLGTDMNTFTTNLGTFDESKVTTVKCAANAIKALAQAASALPNEGGWAAKILGENSIATFGSYLPKLGTNLASFASNLGTFDETKVNTVTCAANAIKNIAEAAKKIPNEGGWAAKIFGDNSISTFGDKLPGLGEDLSSFASNLGTFDDAKVQTVTCAANAIKSMAQAAKDIPNEGGWAAKIFGDNGIGAFGKKLEGVGTNLKNFAANLGTFGEDKVATVNSAVNAIKALSKLANADLSGAKKNLSGFGDKVVDFASDLAAFCDGMPSPSVMSIATLSIKKILDAIDDISGRDPSILTNFSKKLKSIGTDGVDKFVKAFTSSAAKTDAKEAGKKLMDAVADGIETKEKAVDSASKDAAKSGADAASEKKSSFKSAGKDLGSGLVEGINAKQQAAYDAGYALGQKAVQGEKDGQKSNSPSKLTIQAGKWLGEGLVIGIGKMTSAVYNAGYGLGEGALDPITSAISRIGEVVNGNIDAEPTIRPVLDLSDVTAGARSISGMFDMNPSVGLMSNIGSISSMMSSGQNGNDDVVSAINSLRKSLSGISGETININGITYDDGSNINAAVREIVRAARMERRV